MKGGIIFDVDVVWNTGRYFLSGHCHVQDSLIEEGALSAVGADESFVPASEFRELKKQVRELERLLCRKTMEVEILKEAV